MKDECERLAEIQAVIDEMADRADAGAVILVEGRRDRESLEALGITGKVVMTSQLQLFNLAERVASEHDDVILMSDWDERGDEVAQRSEIYLKSNGVRPDCELRKKLRALLKGEVKDIESLYKYMERLRRACSAKPQHY